MTDDSFRDQRDRVEPTQDDRSGDGRSAVEPRSPGSKSRHAGGGEAALVMKPWQSLLLAFVASIAVWGTLEAIMPVFQLPEHLQSFGNDATAALKQEQVETNALCRARNATLSIALLACILALSIAAAELSLRGERLRAVWGGALAGLLAAAVAIGAGTVGATSIEALALPDHRLFKTMILQSGTLGVLGLAVGLGISLALFRTRLLATCTGGCLLGGLLAAFLFPIVAGMLMPRLNTEFLMPEAGVGRLLWIGLASSLIGVAVTGLGKEKGRGE